MLYYYIATEKLSENLGKNSNLTCPMCNVSFATEQERDQHIKLEHQTQQDPTGVQ